MVVKVWNNFYVATVADVDRMTEKQRQEFSIIGACKYPLHARNARIDGAESDGYYGKKMTKHNSEYNYCERGGNLFLNIVPAVEVSQINDEAIRKAMKYMDNAYMEKKDVLIVDSNGRGRSPSLILLWFIHVGFMDKKETAEEVMTGFKRNIYKPYSPSQGMIDYIKKVFNERKDYYAKQKEKGLR